MQHFHLRCKHCHREYTYCTYGNGPEYGTEAGCSMEYCAECKKAIDEALAAIPIKYSWKFKEIKEPRIFDFLAKVKKEYLDNEKHSVFPSILETSYFWDGYDNREDYRYKGRTYVVRWNDATPDKKIVTIKAEYDLIKKDFTGKAWEDYDDRKTYYHYCRPTKLFSSDSDSNVGLTPPTGKLFFLDGIWEWDIETPHKHDWEEPKKEHILRQYHRTINGASLINSRLLKCMYLDLSTIEPMLDYDCLFEKYDDEEYEVLIDINVT